MYCYTHERIFFSSKKSISHFGIINSLDGQKKKHILNRRPHCLFPSKALRDRIREISRDERDLIFVAIY